MKKGQATYLLSISPLPQKGGGEMESIALATLMRRLPVGGWEEIEQTRAFIGRNGTGKRREGDGRTPCGELHIVRAFGIMPNPGTSLEYLRVTPDTIACDSPGPFYNKIIRRSDSDGKVEGEEMFKMSPEYDYGLETDYNSACEYPLGSAIFLHCKGQRPYTAGCLAFDREFMIRLLILASDGLSINIPDSAKR